MLFRSAAACCLERRELCWCGCCKCAALVASEVVLCDGRSDAGGGANNGSDVVRNIASIYRILFLWIKQSDPWFTKVSWFSLYSCNDSEWLALVDMHDGRRYKTSLCVSPPCRRRN